jgi:hypothetical protein
MKTKEIKLPFGVYKGKKLSEIPVRYLKDILPLLDEALFIHHAIKESISKRN